MENHDSSFFDKFPKKAFHSNYLITENDVLPKYLKLKPRFEVILKNKWTVEVTKFIVIWLLNASDETE